MLSQTHFSGYRKMAHQLKGLEAKMEDVPKLLEGKKALISGAGRGIGKSIALAFAKNGAQVALIARTKRDIDTAASEIAEKFHTTAIPLAGDVSSKEGSKGLVNEAELAFKRIDILVCAAGFPLQPEIWEKGMHELEEEEIKKIFEVDVLGSFRLVKEVIPLMISQKKGVVILFSSTPAIAGYGKGGAYTISKAANLGFVKELAAGYGQYNIRAYAIAPGNIRTERTYNPLSADEREALASEASMRRWGKPEEVASVAVALASDDLSFVTGQTIIVDGGTVMV
jgi:3-oxoacyl-[acyl-carrier protein] reductase